MPSDEGEPRRPEVSRAEDRQRALAEVLRAAAESGTGKWSGRSVRRRRTSRALVATFLVCLATALWVQLGSPPWLRPDVEVPSPQDQERFLRMSMYMQAQKIERFRSDRGRLPNSLEEAGDPIPGIEYARTRDRTYRLIGRRGSAGVEYASTEPLPLLLGVVDSTAGSSDADPGGLGG